MSPQFTDDDVGKDVVNAEGDQVGMVVDIEHGTAHVEPDPGLTDSIKATLGWSDSGEDTYPLQEEAVARVTADEIRLEGDLSSGRTADTGGTQGMDTGGSTDSDPDVGMTDTGTGDTDTETVGSDTDTGTPGTGTESDRGIDRDEDDISGADDEDAIRRDDDDPLMDDDDDLIGDDTDEGLMSDDDDDRVRDDT